MLIRKSLSKKIVDKLDKLLTRVSNPAILTN